jgi:zinc D-Ala-D-Ala carboxypeptidase
MPNRQLSAHFNLHELTASQTATRKGISEQFDPPADVVGNLEYLCENLLEKLRTLNGNKPLFLSSGYRCPRLNTAVKGAKKSQHLTGEAADIDLGSKEANKAFFTKIQNSGIAYDQLINEYDFSWVHISLKKTGNRLQALNVTTSGTTLSSVA